ncbi:MAG: phage Gp37/Gp68 family protein [Faecalibacterium sp.]|nr:phage Gp37/Gp68 family protein [Ruminococcus sp.]MCM1391311.1 phage Gp37/Gp68 family protein [Ruminococcus sp.]MCM1484865.1 phage Gp37/Gp68 family protein [Faecalibacterium sp.]
MKISIEGGVTMLWNPWHGCHKCSPGCQNCYVYYLDGIRQKDASVVTRSKTNFNLPLKKDRSGNFKIRPGTEIATCFTSDFFIEEADNWRNDAWKIIKQRSDVNFLICTKRINRFEQCLPSDWGDGYDNVRIAVSCETQKKADERLPILLNIKAKRKYIFAAPILEDIDFSAYLANGEISMVSVGGESYKNARECNFNWVQHIKETCDKYNVEFDFHQTGSNFVMNGKRYKINHHDEYSQAKKGMAVLDAIKNSNHRS